MQIKPLNSAAKRRLIPRLSGMTLVLFSVILTGCSGGSLGRLGHAFNNYHADFMSVSQKTERNIKGERVCFDLYLYGNDEEKNADWDKMWRSRHPEWGAAQWVSVSSEVPQIWGDLREIDKRYVASPPALNHELLHVIKLKIKEFIDPDQLSKH